MYKKGQFFLIAALIIIIVVFSVATVYNSVSYSKSDLPYAQDLAISIKQEMTQIIDSGFYNNLAQEDITANLNNLTLAYSKSNPSYNITYLSFYNDVYFANNFYNNVVLNIPESNVFLTNSNTSITLSLNNVNHSFNLSKGYNIFVVVQEENNNEKYIATA
jgi:uncharacterized protein YpmB